MQLRNNLKKASVTSYKYDNGNLCCITNPRGIDTYFDYDGFGRLIEEKVTTQSFGIGTRFQGRAIKFSSPLKTFAQKRLLCGAMSEMSWYKAFNFEIPFRFAVSAIEWKHANSFAPSSVLNPPETLDFTFNTLKEASLALSKSCDNASERGVRKIKQKVSGCFRIDEGADDFAKLHSIAETAMKKGNSKFNVILAVVQQQDDYSCP